MLRVFPRGAPSRVGPVNARGRICTCTGDALDVVSLLLDYASEKWSLPPVLPRQDFFTKEIRRLLRGGENCEIGARVR